MRPIVRWLATSLALYLTVRWVSGLHPSGPLHWVLASALAVGVLNVLGRPEPVTGTVSRHVARSGTGPSRSGAPRP